MPAQALRAVHVDALPELTTPPQTVVYAATARHDGRTVALGRYETAGTYPLGPAGYAGASAAIAELAGGLPAGPWPGAADHLARGMSISNALQAYETQLTAAARLALPLRACDAPARPGDSEVS